MAGEQATHRHTHTHTHTHMYPHSKTDLIRLVVLTMRWNCLCIPCKGKAGQ